MSEFEDPIEIYRQALERAPRPVEEHPPVIQRVEVWPYPELDRLWLRLETSPFAALPNLAFTLFGPDGEVVSNMFVIEARTAYQSLTMHLRQPPRPGERYRLEIELSRDDETLDQRAAEFDLVYREPGAA